MKYQYHWTTQHSCQAHVFVQQEVTEVPHTEAVLVSSHHHQQQHHVTPAVPHDRTPPSTSYDRRLSELEHQLASLLQRSKVQRLLHGQYVSVSHHITLQGPARTKKSSTGGLITM